MTYLKTLIWFFIFLTLSTSISSNLESSTSTTSKDLKQAQEVHSKKSILTHGDGEKKACSSRDYSAHAVEVQILNEYGNRVLPFYSKKGLNKKAKGRSLAGHRASSKSKKNRAFSPRRTSSFAISAVLCFVTFIFFLL